MAHVSVIRRSMLPPEWIAIRIRSMGRWLIEKSVPLPGWQIREARQVGECRYEYDDTDFRPIQSGDLYFLPDGTAFLRNTFTMSAELSGQEVWLQFETASEMHVKCNGQWLGGVDPNRSRVLLREAAVAGETVELEIEGYNRSKPDDLRSLSTCHLRGCRQAFPHVQLVTVDHDIEAAWYDVAVLQDAIQSDHLNADIREYITEHLDRALNLYDHEAEDRDTVRRQLAEVREYLEKTVFSAKQTKGFTGTGRVALVAHSHLDIAYFWRRIHAVQKNARTCLIQLRLMDRYPDFCYTHSQAFTYELLERHQPDLFEEVKQRIAEGRFEPVGAMYIEPDCNLPSAESLIRQCFYGQHYFRKTFNLTVRNCWLPDVFGNSWIMPQILRKCGMDYFVSNKMSTWNDTNRFPHNHFIWKGIDGTGIPACVPPTHFITWNTPEQVIANWDAFQEKSVSPETLNMFGFGDGGSGVTEPMLEYMARLSRVPGLPEIRHCRADEFLDACFADPAGLETWDGELYLEMHRGTFTTMGRLKKGNRVLEIALRDAEMLAAFAALEGAVYPTADIEAAWKKLLVNQFHDILPGTHIAPVTRDALEDYNELAEVTTHLIVTAAETLLEPSNHATLTVVNTLGQVRRGTQFLPGITDAISDLVNQPGDRDGAPGLWIELPELAGGGMLTLEPIAGAANATDNEAWHQFENGGLETPFYRIRFNPDGSIVSLIDKISGRELVSTGGAFNRMHLYHDYPGLYDAWDILPNYADKEDGYQAATPLRLVETGPLFMVLETELKLNRSVWKQRIRLFRNEPRIEFDHEVDWHERNRLAKVEFDFNLLSRKLVCDLGAGFVERPTHSNTTWEQARFEVCHHQWADLAEADFGVALLNNGKYGISCRENRVGLSLLRGTVRPDPFADEGEHRFSYALLPHEGNHTAANVARAGREFNTPLRIFNGRAAAAAPLFHSDSPNLHVLAIKAPENGEPGLIVRLCECHGNRGTAEFALQRPITAARKTDMLEDLCDEEQPELRGGRLVFSYKPFEIITLKLSTQ